jgi:hypothetical protein
LFSGARTALRTVTAPAQSKVYTVINATTGGFSVKLVGAGPTTGVTIVAGESAVCAWNGSDFVKVSNTGGSAVFTTLDVTNLDVTNIRALDGTAAASIANSTGVISFVSNPVFSGGTANGVAYLNGSKVVTSGSVLTFNGSYLTANGLRLSGADTANTIYQSTGNLFITADAGTLALQANSSNPIAFYLNSSEQMRLTSTGLGIGTSSPSNKLVLAESGATSVYQQFLNNSSGNIGYIGLTSGGTYVLQTNNLITFSTGASYTERMRLDSSGNLGLGVTPSAWLSGITSFDIANGGSLFGGSVLETSGVYLAANAFYNSSGNGTYKANGFAPMYNVSGSTGAHKWFNAPSGTAGNTIAFTQAMTLDASGNLGVGTTSPFNPGSTAQKTIEIAGSSYATIYLSANSATIRAQFGADNVGSTVGIGSRTNHPLTFITNDTERARINSSGQFLVGVTSASGRFGVSGSGGSSSGDIVLDSNASYSEIQSYNTKPLYINRQGNNVLTCVDSGALLVGTTSQYASSKLSVNGSGAFNTGGVDGTYTSFINAIYAGNTAQFASIQHSMSSAAGASGFRFLGGGAGGGGTTQQKMYDMTRGAHIFYITDSEVARIDGSGILLVGRSAADVGTNGFRVDPSGSIYASIATGNETNYVYSTSAAAYRFYVNAAGTVFATTTTISAISDIRFKENVRDLDAGLEKVMALKPRLYDWKEGKGADIKNARGFIAQEFETVFPDLIDEWKDPAPEGEEPYKSVRQDLIPVLVKAIQEQQDLIETLTQRITALEGR